MRYGAIGGLVLVLGLVLAWTPSARVQEPAGNDDPLVEKVRKAIDKGIRFLKDQEAGRGNVEAAPLATVFEGGCTALGTLALLNSGVPADDPSVQRCLKYLRDVKLAQTYVVGLQAMAFAQAGQIEDKERVQRCVDWLIEARMMSGGRLQGWTYNKSGGVADNSNTQYALLGLHEGKLAGARIDDAVWQGIRDFYINTQNDNGGWGYRPRMENRLTMTLAGLCGLLIAGMDLNEGRETILPNGTVKNCGEYVENRSITKAMDWLGEHLPRRADDINRLGHTYYLLYGIERTGRLSGQRFLGGNDWYRIGCEFLVTQQQADGSWVGKGHEVGVIASSFALLFLSKGRTPVLVSKLVHDPEDDWNNDRNDARYLVEFCSRELFKKQPLAWQVFDARQGGDLNRPRVQELTADLLQSPVAYFNGHQPPRFRAGEEELLKEYVANGGFLLAEACCGDKRFDAGFRALMRQLFPETPLKPLPPEHPIWRASGKWESLSAKVPLEGIEMGCKTVVVYSPRDLSCWWESNKHDQGKGRDAFRLGANIVAYATGMEPPRPRLTEVQVLQAEDDRKIPRGYLKVAQVRHQGDWRPAPRAMPNLMLAMRQLGLDVTLQTEEIHLGSRDLVDFRFLYMHGRNAFSFAPEEIKQLRFHLDSGGLLLADACCGSKAYDVAFRKLIQDLWPGQKLEPIPPQDELYGRELNGSPITSVKCRREGPDGKPEAAYRSVAPSLEGIKVNGRWAVIYSRYDIGCALEKHQSTDCLGHDHDSAVRLGRAAVLYALRR